ncbi:MAG: RNA polymerase factor sigma-32 [Alphaproteobacteria bacterium]
MQQIRKFPLLSAEDEYNLAVAYKESKSRKVADKLINSHLRLVVKVVDRYKGYGLSVEEMISEGNIGLLNALEKFEPEKGFRFSTYALWWIKAGVQKYILNSWSLVKIGTTISQKKLFFNLKKIKNQLKLYDDKMMNSESISSIADMLNVTETEVKDMNARISAHDSSLNIIVGNEGETELQDFIKDSRPNQEDVFIHAQTQSYRKELFNKAFTTLKPREKDILSKRRLQDKVLTLDELSNIYHISKERVRQIEMCSIRKIQNVLNLSA